MSALGRQQTAPFGEKRAWGRNRTASAESVTTAQLGSFALNRAVLIVWPTGNDGRPLMIVPPEIRDLVENPRETLEVELKEWLDPSLPINRAKIARHLCALANHGGGYLIFGICDDLSLDPEHPGDISPFGRDEFASIIEKYLTPTFQCDVFVVATAVAGRDCVVVRVPTHGPVPICARSNGPSDEKGRTQGIREGEHYSRLPGPKSEAIKTPEQWRPLIHRCVLSERQIMLESIGRIIGASAFDTRETGRTLEAFHKAMDKHVKELL
jgi:hypothetical protein